MKRKISIAIAVIAVLLITGFTMHRKAGITYADFRCPVCGGVEVLDLGYSQHGTHYKCPDCRRDFYEDNGYE